MNIPPRNIEITQPEKGVFVPSKIYLECSCIAEPVADMYMYRNDIPTFHYTTNTNMVIILNFVFITVKHYSNM